VDNTLGRKEKRQKGQEYPTCNKTKEGKSEGRQVATGRRGRRCKKLLDDLKEKRGYLI
jgi:hypothetical protein